MANVRAGVAYVDVRLGSIEQFKNALKSQIETVGADAGKQMGESLSKAVPAAKIGSKLGTDLDRELSRSFFREANNDFGAGFRALSTGQFGTAKELFASAGRNFSSAFSGGFKNTAQAFGDIAKDAVSKVTSRFEDLRQVSSKIGGFFDSAASAVSNFASRATSAAKTAWTGFQTLGKHLDDFSQKAGYLSFQIKNFGLVATAAFTAPVSAAIGFGTAIGLKVASQLENATAALKFLLPKGYDLEALIKRLQAIALASPIFDTADLLQYAQIFQTAGVNIDETTRFLKAFSNIALVTGANTDQAKRSIIAITQVFGKGKLQAEELNQQLGESMPAVLKIIRDSLGVTQKQLTQMVKEGKISGEDLIRIFTRVGESDKFVKGAAAGAQTLSATWQNFQESVQTQLGEFFLKNSKQIEAAINKLSPAISQLITAAEPFFLGLINNFGKLVNKFVELMNWYQKLSPGTKDLINKFIVFGAVIGPVVIAAGSLLGAIAGIAAGIAAVATPVGAIVAGIVALGAAIAVGIIWLKKFLAGNSEAAQKVKAAWNGFYDSVIRPIVEGFKNLWASIVAAFNQVKNSLGGNQQAWSTWGGWLKEFFIGVWGVIKSTFLLIVDILKTVLNVIGPIIEAIGSLISGIIKIFKGLTDFLVGVFTGDWKRAWTGIKEIWDGLWDAIIGTLFNIGKAIWNAIKGIVEGVINFFKHLFDVLVGHSIVPDLVNLVISWFRKLTAPINAVISVLRGYFNAFISAVQNLGSRVGSGISSVINWFKRLPGEIKGALSSAGSWLYNIGRDIVNGLVNGVRSVGGYLKNAILDLIPGPVKTIVANALGINSPSRVFMEYGKYVVQGFVNGISGEHRNLSNSLDVFSQQPRFQQMTGSPSAPLMDKTGASSALQIENYYANDNVDPWRQAEDWYFLVTSRGGVS